MATPRERRYEKTRAAILNAARTILRQHGVEKLTMRQLAEAIDYSPAALYEYFGGKDALLDALCAESDARFRQYLLKVDAAAPPAERLVQCGLNYVRFALDYPEEFLLLMHHRRTGRTSLQEPVAGAGSYSVLLQLVEELVNAGEIQPGPVGVEGVAYSCWALVHGMAMLRLTHLQTFQADFEQANRWALEKFIAGLRP